jgi:hypothetical protein
MMKANFEGDLDRAIKTTIESEITSPTTRALLEWIQEERTPRRPSTAQEYIDAYGLGDEGDNYTGPTYMEYDD